MGEIYYNLEFKGQVAPVEGKDGVFRAASQASSCNIATTVSPRGVRGKATSKRASEPAQFESQVVVTGKDSFQEKGKITFGKSGKHGFSFTTAGAGSFKTGPKRGGMHGGVTWRITRGFGQFKGAHGYITSNFTVDGKGKLVDRQIGHLHTKGK